MKEGARGDMGSIKRSGLYLLTVLALSLACSEVRPKRLILVTINDIYRIEGVAGGKEGGLARVRTLRSGLEAEGVPVLLFHAGDALMPAAMSRRYKGQQMVDILNLLDGDPQGFDDRMWMTFGNHEFDLKEAGDLDARIEESQFTWLSGNIRFSDGPDGKPLIQAPNLHRMALVERGGIKLGILSQIIDAKTQPYIASFEDVMTSAKEMLSDLKSQGAEVVIGLTHLNLSQDEELLQTLGPLGLDLILGGHDHQHMAEDVDGRFIFKADADAKSAMVVELTFDGEKLDVRHRLERLNQNEVKPDPLVSRRVAEWFADYDPEGKLAEQVGFTRVLLNAEETVIRRYETALGNWVADQMRDAMAAQGAQIAFIHSGTLRLNDIIYAHSPITRGHIDELLPYAQNLVLVRLDGATLDKVLQHSVSDWSSSGHWLQVSGLRFVHDAAGERAQNIEIREGDGWRPLGSGDEVLAVTSEYLAQGNDDYDMLNSGQIIAAGSDLKELVLAQLAAAGEAGIAPRVEGRIQLKDAE